MILFLATLGCRETRPPRDFNAVLHGEWSAPVKPFRVVGNIYYVGAKNIASYLLTSAEGHVLIDSGTREMAPVVQRNIEQLGFQLRDVKILLNSHAHYDHVQSHAALKRLTGARVLVMHEDAEAVRTGVDRSPLGDEGWEPVVVDGELRDDETVTLGDTTLRAILAPGHTPGCTVWTTTTRDTARTYEVVFYGCVRPNDEVKLVGNARFPRLIEQTQDTFRRMTTLTPDIYLTMHPEQQFAGKLDALVAGTRPHPLDDRAAWPALIHEYETEFAERVARARREPAR
ncbi:MAG: subclass B3 metallo-beta-lactamase [Kofleriaceae bacterium]